MGILAYRLEEHRKRFILLGVLGLLVLLLVFLIGGIVISINTPQLSPFGDCYDHDINVKFEILSSWSTIFYIFIFLVIYVPLMTICIGGCMALSYDFNLKRGSHCFLN